MAIRVVELILKAVKTEAGKKAAGGAIFNLRRDNLK